MFSCECPRWSVWSKQRVPNPELPSFSSVLVASSDAGPDSSGNPSPSSSSFAGVARVSGTPRRPIRRTWLTGMINKPLEDAKPPGRSARLLPKSGFMPHSEDLKRIWVQITFLLFLSPLLCAVMFLAREEGGVRGVGWHLPYPPSGIMGGKSSPGLFLKNQVAVSSGASD